MAHAAAPAPVRSPSQGLAPTTYTLTLQPYKPPLCPAARSDCSRDPLSAGAHAVSKQHSLSAPLLPAPAPSGICSPHLSPFKPRTPGATGALQNRPGRSRELCTSRAARPAQNTSPRLCTCQLEPPPSRRRNAHRLVPSCLQDMSHQ